MNLLIGNILELDPIAGVISQVRTLVQWFKTGHAPLHELGQKQQHFLGKSIALALPCKMRWQLHMDCLRLVLDSKVALKSVVLEPKVRQQLKKRCGDIPTSSSNTRQTTGTKLATNSLAIPASCTISQVSKSTGLVSNFSDKALWVSEMPQKHLSERKQKPFLSG